MPTPADDDRETIAWPFWMLRFVATDDPDAFSDLIWSVGGSPPYGGVSYDEGAAVYELLESYRGAGEATPEAYDAVRAHIADNVERQDALEHIRLGRDVGIELLTDAIGPPAALCPWANHAQAVLVKLPNKRLVIGDAVQMYAMQVDR